jgi:hypothetical protein
MRTKTLLLSAAAIAAGLVSSFAQSNVYSANIVGYVTYSTKTNAPGYEAINVPLVGATNTLRGMFPTAPGGTQILLWNGSGYNIATFTALLGGSWKTNGQNADTTPLTPGMGLFISASSAFTNTFVGSIIAAPGQGVTNTIPSGLQLVGSQVPYDGNVTNGAALNLTGVAGGTQLLIWNPTAQSFDIYTWSALLGGHWKLNGNNVDPILNVNQGLFINSATPYNWVQVGPQ